MSTFISLTKKTNSLTSYNNFKNYNGWSVHSLSVLYSVFWYKRVFLAFLLCCFDVLFNWPLMPTIRPKVVEPYPQATSTLMSLKALYFHRVKTIRMLHIHVIPLREYLLESPVLSIPGFQPILLFPLPNVDGTVGVFLSVHLNACHCFTCFCFDVSLSIQNHSHYNINIYTLTALLTSLLLLLL